MTGIILDTNVISEPLAAAFGAERSCRLACSTEYRASCSSLRLWWASLRSGLRMLPPRRRRDRLEAWLSELLHEQFAGRILPYDH